LERIFEMNKIIGISGLAGDGKDSLCNMLRVLFEGSGYAFERMAFAEEIKEECREALMSMYNINPLTCSREDKSTIRDFLVFYAKVKREESSGTHWVKKLDKKIKALPKSKLDRIICIPDVRHAQYEKDEAQWIKKKKGILIHVKKYQLEEAFTFKKSYSIPVNNEEATHTPKLEALADFVIEWQDTSPVAPENSHFSRELVIELFILIRDLLLVGPPKETKRLSKSQKARKNIEKLKKI
jgi:hypothetical protein